MSRSQRIMLPALLLLAAVFGWGFRHNTGVMLFAAMPPLLLAIALGLRIRAATFWSGVFALFWFSYGVMEAWTQSGVARALALAILALALLIVIASSWSGMRARFGRRAGPG